MRLIERERKKFQWKNCDKVVHISKMLNYFVNEICEDEKKKTKIYSIDLKTQFYQFPAKNKHTHHTHTK